MPMGTTMAAEEQHQETEAIDAEVVIDFEGRKRNPRMGFLELECAGGCVEVKPENESERERGKTECEGGRTGQVLAEGEDDKRADNGQYSEERQHRKSAHAFAPHSRKITRATSAQTDHAQIRLDAAALKQRENPAAARNARAAARQNWCLQRRYRRKLSIHATPRKR